MQQNTLIRNREPLTSSEWRMQKLLHFHRSLLLAPVCLIFFYSCLWWSILVSFCQFFQLLRQERLPRSCCCQEKYFLSLHHLLKLQQKASFSPLTSLSLLCVFLCYKQGMYFTTNCRACLCGKHSTKQYEAYEEA